LTEASGIVSSLHGYGALESAASCRLDAGCSSGATVRRTLRAARLMPRISAFYGIVIWMYHDEAHHSGRPHFHATYGGDEATVDIESLAILAGGLPPRGQRLVVEWAQTHQAELRENWVRARHSQPLASIEPLR
jgi:hypothetical protein